MADRKKPKRLFSYGELLIPAIIISSTIIFLLQSIGIKKPEENLRLVWIVVAGLGICMIFILVPIVKKIVQKVEADESVIAETKDHTIAKRQALLFLLVVIYLIVMNFVGFIISTLIMMPLMFMAGGVYNYKNIAIISILFAFLIYIIFRKFFNILLPEGFIEEFLINNILFR